MFKVTKVKGKTNNTNNTNNTTHMTDLTIGQSDYICPPIKSYIQNQELVKYSKTESISRSLDFSASSIPCSVNMYFPKTLKYDVNYLFGVVFFLVHKTANMRWSDKKWKGPLGITIYFTPFAKTWDYNQKNKKQIIGPCHMNSGETDFFAGGRREILIWRREDFHKVLIHELLHAFDWDRLIPPHLQHNSSTKEHHAEAIVEAVANMCHVEFLANGNKTRKLQLQKKERQLMLNQAQCLHPQRMYWSSPKTHTHEYVILKAALLFCKESQVEFLRWLSLDSEKECWKLWPKLIENCMNRLKRVMPMNCPESGCLCLHLVATQLPLVPYS